MIEFLKMFYTHINTSILQDYKLWGTLCFSPSPSTCLLFRGWVHGTYTIKTKQNTHTTHTQMSKNQIIHILPFSACYG